MTESRTLLHVRAAGRQLLLPVIDLREVVAFTQVTSLPGGPRGIEGVVLHQGEFLPVLDWTAMTGGPEPLPPASVMAVLRRRLGLPLERLIGTLEVPVAGWREAPEGDPWHSILAGLCTVGEQEVPLLDPERLLALLHRLRKDR
jgi:chemotaxis signal transduction protein